MKVSNPLYYLPNPGSTFVNDTEPTKVFKKQAMSSIFDALQVWLITYEFKVT